MWIMTTAGFYSAVQDKQDTSLLSVRTRDRESAQIAVDSLEMWFGEVCEVRTGEGTDYPYRFTVKRENFAQWAAQEIMEYLNYTNFKSAAKSSRGEDWESALMNVWVAMMAVTDEEMQDHGYYGTIYGKTNPHYADYSDLEDYDTWEENQREG
jgi:hypothetical protein